MIVKCIKSYAKQLNLNALYLVVEMYISMTKGTVSFRVLDNDGCPAIYPSGNFELVSNSVNGFGVVWHNGEIVLSPELIIKSDLNMKDLEGFWGCYFDNTEYTEQAVKTLKLVIECLSAEETQLSSSHPFLEDRLSLLQQNL